MKKVIFSVLLLFVGFILGTVFKDIKQPSSNSQFAPAQEKSLIIETLTQQSQSWNAGDIESFMMDYWNSDRLRFASGGTVKYGWQTTLDRYKARYPDKATMGTLTFTDLEISVLSDRDAIVFGRWTLTRDSDTPNGLFTLQMRKENDRWIIVSDHTSSSD